MWPGIAKRISQAFHVPWYAFWYALGAVTVIFGVGLGFIAWSSASAKWGLWAVVLLLMAPGIAVLGTPGRRQCEQAGPPASAGVLSHRLRQAEFALTIIRAARTVVLIALSYLAVLWLCELGDLNSAGGFLLPYTWLCIGSLAAYLPWLGRRERRVAALTQTRRAEVKTFKGSRGWIPD